MVLCTLLSSWVWAGNGCLIFAPEKASLHSGRWSFLPGANGPGKSAFGDHIGKHTEVVSLGDSTNFCIYIQHRFVRAGCQLSALRKANGGATFQGCMTARG
jgi:hypothetical protein